MWLTRLYYNSTPVLIRTDKLQMLPQNNFTSIVNYDGGNGPQTPSIKRSLQVEPSHAASGGGGAPISRVIDRLEVTGDFDSIESVTGDYQYAEWTRGNSTTIKMDMTDLPKCGDTI